MKAKLTTEQSEALMQSEVPLSLVDPRTDRIYVLVDQSTHVRAMEALERQLNDDEAVIRQGIIDMEARHEMSLDDSRARTNAALARLSQ